MNILTQRDVHERLARATSKWIVVHGLDIWLYAVTENISKGDVLNSCGWLDGHSDSEQILFDGQCVVLFNTEDEARQFYTSLPTDDNPIGDVLFFAQLISPVDGPVSEST